MSKESEHTFTTIGLPRANSNGLFLLGLTIVLVFAVMLYSCDRRKKNGSDVFGTPSQPLSGNEWFVGRASGIELPRPTPLPTAPRERQAAIRKVKLRKIPPAKKLGGKIFGSSAKQTSNQKPNHTAPLRIEKSRPEYYLAKDIERPVSDFEVKAGTIIPAQLDLGINSDLGGPAVAHITRNVYDTVSGAFLLIPPGTKLYGKVKPNVSFGQTRVDVIWERLIFPNGASLVLENMRAADGSGQTGLHHTVDNHLDRLYGGAVLLSAISAGVQLSQPQRSANFGSAPSLGQTLSASLGQNLGQVSTELIRRQMDVRPTIVIPNGEHFTVTVNKDMVLPGPWGTWE